MNKKQQQIAIAKACGWRKMKAPKKLGFGASAPDKCWYFIHQLPDYLNDLNAMHEAEKSLNLDQKRKHAWILTQLLNNFTVWLPDEYESLSCWDMSLHDISACLAATAAQRAEAFLRTLNLWTE